MNSRSTKEDGLEAEPDSALASSRRDDVCDNSFAAYLTAFRMMVSRLPGAVANLKERRYPSEMFVEWTYEGTHFDLSARRRLSAREVRVRVVLGVAFEGSHPGSTHRNYCAEGPLLRAAVDEVFTRHGAFLRAQASVWEAREKTSCEMHVLLLDRKD